MQMHGSTNKSPIKLSMQRKIKDIVICLRMGKTNTTKTPPANFKVITPEIPLLSQQAVTRNPSTLYQPTVKPLPQYPIGLVL